MMILLEILGIRSLLFCMCCLLLVEAGSPVCFIILDWGSKLKERYLEILMAWIQGSFVFSSPTPKCLLVSSQA